ncbi:MerR family transcriptional regulator [Pseudomonas aeruginosa]
MKIGELAKLTGLATSRIRFYEASGLIRSQRKANGYRDYAADTVWILDLVTGAQGAGFSLEEIARLLPSGDGAWQHGELLEGLRRKVAEIEALQRRLEQNKAQLLVAIESIENKPDGLQCTENTQRVLERLREEGPPQTVGRPRQTRSRGSSPTPAEQRLSDA